MGALLAETPVLAVTPAYEYLARRLGVELVTLSWDDFASLSYPAALDELDGALAAHPARLVLDPARPDGETMAAFAARDLSPVVFETAAAVTSSEVAAMLAEGMEALGRAALESRSSESPASLR